MTNRRRNPDMIRTRRPWNTAEPRDGLRPERSMQRKLIVAIFALTLLPAPPGFAQADDANLVSGITVSELDEATEIRVTGQQHATYSVYRLRNPLRLFVDISETRLQQEIAPVTIDNGVVSQVAAVEYEDELATVTRVVVGFDQDALYDVNTDGDDLVITVDGSGRNLFVTGPPTTAEDMELLHREIFLGEQRIDAMADALADAQSRASTAEAELLQAQLDRQRAEQARLAALTATEALEAEYSETIEITNARVDALVADRADAEARIAAQQQQLTSLDAERQAALGRIESLQADTAANELALAERDAALAQAESRAAEFEAAIAAQQAAGATEAELAELAAEHAQLVAELETREGELAALVSESQRAEAELADALAEARASQEAQQDVIARQAETIAALEAMPAPTPAPVQAPQEAWTSPAIRDIRFEHVDGMDRVVIETAGSIEYAALPLEDGRSAITFAGAELPDALRRTLDTRAFEGPVAFVSSYTDADGAVRVVAEMTRNAAEVLRQDAGNLVWEFAARPEAEVFAAVAASTTLPTSHAEPMVAAATSYGSTASPYSIASGSGGGDSPFLRRPRMTRKRVTIDLRDADVANILRLIADEGNINIVSSSDVAGSVTLRLRSVPLDDALVVILRSLGLGWEQQGNIIRVAPITEFEAEYDREIEMLENAWRLEPLRVRLVPVNYAEADQLASLVSSVLSDRGDVTVDRRNNTLVITDVVNHLDTAQTLVEQLDNQTPQILIEARIVETNDQFRRQLGIQWGGDYVADQSLGNSTGLLFPSTVGIAGGASDGQEPTAGTSSSPNFAVNLPAPAGTGTGGALGFTFGSLSGALNLNLRLSAAENSGTAKVVSAPRIMATNNGRAVITSGVSIPVSVVSAAGAQTVFFDASLNLDVTPRVTPDGNIFLEVNISKNEPDFENTGARGDPSIIRREASTQLLIRDGDTTVIGGIFQRNSGYSQSRVPFFGHLPVIGPLFRNSSQTDVRNELLVFITPRIVNRDLSIDALGGDDIQQIEH